ncbi:unnamed protein product [Arctia plantaginis]|uniref:DUF7041 domain-containing protein n=1 Tax=Arctia plantaginis TaxID=874455 RepID=A0A8S0YXJ7_ARCPL|nr:unnamed protein product [Arctia plantaginis]
MDSDNTTEKASSDVFKLDCRQSAEIEDIIISPPETGKYDNLKSELIQQLSTSREKKVHQLIRHEELGDRKPS